MEKINPNDSNKGARRKNANHMEHIASHRL